MNDILFVFTRTTTFDGTGDAHVRVTNEKMNVILKYM